MSGALLANDGSSLQVDLSFDERSTIRVSRHRATHTGMYPFESGALPDTPLLGPVLTGTEFIWHAPRKRLVLALPVTGGCPHVRDARADSADVISRHDLGWSRFNDTGPRCLSELHGSDLYPGECDASARRRKHTGTPVRTHRKPAPLRQSLSRGLSKWTVCG